MNNADRNSLPVYEEICALRQKACRALIEPKIELVISKLEELSERLENLQQTVIWIQRLFVSALFTGIITFAVRMTLFHFTN